METENAIKLLDAKMHHKYRILATKVKQILNSNNPYNILRKINLCIIKQNKSFEQKNAILVPADKG